MAQRIGNFTVEYLSKPAVVGYGSVVGKREYEGPLSLEFDNHDNDSRFGEKSFEKAESRMQKIALETALHKSGLNEKNIDIIFAGDLLNQCVGSSFGLRSTDIQFAGIYGACSTMALGIIMASTFVECGAAKCAAAVTSSHFCSAERQYRYPLEYGSVRPQSAQWTVTGAGASILSTAAGKPYIDKACIGKIVDLGVKDANNMGAAMAPSAADTLINFFNDTNTTPEDYDRIFTGDLGNTGSELLYILAEQNGYKIREKHDDCGLMIFDRHRQDVHSGGSGCGCSGSVLNSYVYHGFEKGVFKNVIFMSTGALLSPTSTLQGESIPGISHLINIRI
ncbi:MAG: stage V sporulation protein AD [Clostridia bacterium]|nr:stage V sporulation protein AD [Clostridia bacterium]